MLRLLLYPLDFTKIFTSHSCLHHLLSRRSEGSFCFLSKGCCRNRDVILPLCNPWIAIETSLRLDLLSFIKVV